MKSAKERKTKTFKLRMTHDQYLRLRKLARADGRSAGGVIRSLIDKVTG